jgi:hypothetical protein
MLYRSRRFALTVAFAGLAFAGVLPAQEPGRPAAGGSETTTASRSKKSAATSTCSTQSKRVMSNRSTTAS